MRTELPEFKRCCCCLPLRYGLIGWTYIKLMYLLPTIIIVSISIHKMANSVYRYHFTEIIPQIIILVFLVLDVVMNIVFLIGGHTKTVKLLTVQYYYNIVSLVLFALLATTSIGFMLITNYQFFFSYYYGFFILLTNIGIFATGIIIQMYILLLTRSEIRKLTNENVGFRFANNAAQAQCVASLEDTPGFTDTDQDSVPPA